MIYLRDYKYRKQLLILIDVLIIIAVNLFVGMTVFASQTNIDTRQALLHSATAIVSIIIPRFAVGIYRGILRYADAKDYLKLMFADFVGGIIFVASELLIIDKIMGGRTLSVYHMIVAVMMSLLVTIGVHLLYQLLYPYLSVNRKTESSGTRQIKKTEIAIVGAGKKGTMLVRTLFEDPFTKYKPVCFFDNDPQKIGNTASRLPVYNVADADAVIANKHDIKMIVIAINELTPSKKQELFDTFKETGLPLRIYDVSLEASADAPYTDSDVKNKIRSMRIEDLLFRDTIVLENPRESEFYNGKTILVTGAGGSIGSELCRQLAKYKPRRIVMLDIYENNVYDLQQELIRLYGDALDTVIVIASVRDAAKIDHVFAKYLPDIVFHAAAHKHVGIMEDCCDEAVQNNIHGTYNVSGAAEKYGVKKFLLISTDKAVNPTNMMGASKRFCEMIVRSKSDSRTDFVAVRFGNVLGSNGSVIPLFIRQIEAGGPVTITDKRIIRYFMTIPEAAQLLMETCVLAAKNEIFVLDMGEPIKILDLAENMIKLADLRPYIDIDIKEVGLRPGEKLYEELLIKTAHLNKTENSKIFVEKDECLSRERVDEMIAELDAALATFDNDVIRGVMMKLIPTYHDPSEINCHGVINNDYNQLENENAAPTVMKSNAISEPKRIKKCKRKSENPGEIEKVGAGSGQAPVPAYKNK